MLKLTEVNLNTNINNENWINLQKIEKSMLRSPNRYGLLNINIVSFYCHLKNKVDKKMYMFNFQTF